MWGDKDADGFYWGESRGRRGFVPHNMVVEVGEGGAGGVPGTGLDGVPGGAGGTGARRGGDRWEGAGNQQVKRMVALYDYDPQELSPNVDAEVR